MSAQGPKDSPLKPPTRRLDPGERRIEPQVKLKRMQEDVADRIGGHMIDRKNPMEAAHGYVRPDGLGLSADEARTIGRMRRNATRGNPESLQLSASERVKWEQEGRRLGDWLSRHMITKKMTSLRRTDSSEFRQAVNAMSENENSQQFAQVAERWKNIMRAIHPEDQTMANLERIRPS